MKHTLTIIKILTALSYFLPITFFFVSCDSLFSFKIAYNEKDAKEMILLNDKRLHEPCEDSTMTVAENLTMDSLKTDTLTTPHEKVEPKKSEYLLTFFSKLCFPMINTLSGFGAIFYYKDLFGRIFMSISILISVLLIFDKFIPFIQRKRKILYLISIFSLILFIIDSMLIANVSLKWGIWVILILNLIGLLIYIRKTKTSW